MVKKKKNPNREESRIRTVLNRVEIVASKGVNFSFYEPWDPNEMTEDDFKKRHGERELLRLEMELSSS
jgi:metal-sulfur cluster biosynthetic enzyme